MDLAMVVHRIEGGDAVEQELHFRQIGQYACVIGVGLQETCPTRGQYVHGFDVAVACGHPGELLGALVDGSAQGRVLQAGCASGVGEGLARQDASPRFVLASEITSVGAIQARRGHQRRGVAWLAVLASH